jgi:hypothetical protein
MNDLILRLKPKERRGSKPRCHLLTHGSAQEVARRLTALAAPFAFVSADDRWMPQGFVDTEEAQLHKASRLLDPARRELLSDWWLAPASRRARTPNFDIATTCTIDGKPGLLLVEAKAHDEELNKETAGRALKQDSSEDRVTSHRTIAAAIESAREGLEQATLPGWHISRNSHYQISNRFAWSWKVTQLGVPVVLIYLGFLRAVEMGDRGTPFSDHAAWKNLVNAHSKPLFPAEVWDQQWIANGQPFIPLIRSLDQPLDEQR